jgi:hypothetical protein
MAFDEQRKYFIRHLRNEEPLCSRGALGDGHSGFPC